MIFESMINDPMNGKNTQRKIDHTHTHIHRHTRGKTIRARTRQVIFILISDHIFTSTIRDFKDWCTLIDDIFYN